MLFKLEFINSVNFNFFNGLILFRTNLATISSRDESPVEVYKYSRASRNETSKEDTSNEGSRDSSSDEGRGTAGVLDISDDLGGEHLIKSLIVRLNH